MKNTIKYGKCTYCGKKRIITMDHIPPKSLFGVPRPNNLIKVPCCIECHEKTTKDDEYFKTALAMNDAAKYHPDISKVLPSVMRGLNKPNKVGFKRSFLASTFMVSVRSPSGLYLGERLAYRPDGVRMMKVIKRIVKGLYYHHSGKRITKKTELRGDILDPTQLNTIFNNQDFQKNILQPLLKNDPYVIGEELFKYWFQVATHKEHASAWILLFYNSMGFCMFAAPKYSKTGTDSVVA